jgi:argininosuccinate lyase
VSLVDSERKASAGQYVFIESNTTGTGRLCMQRARERGFQVVLLTSQPERYPFLSAELIVPHVIDTTDVDVVCARLHELRDIAGVMSTSEYSIETAARVAARLSLVGPDAEAVRTCRHKGRLVRALERANVNVPQTFEVSSRAALEQLGPTLRFPVVVKPVSGSGSVGVRLVSDRTDLLNVGGALLAETRNQRGIPIASEILVQQYVPGEEYSVEVFSIDGRDHVLGCTKKHLGRAPFFIEMGHDFPARCSPSIEEAIRSEALRALSAVGYRSGPSHVECRLGSNGRVSIIEVNPRLAGGMIPRAMEMATGIDVMGRLIDYFAGRTVDLTPAHHRRAAIRFFVAERPGTIEAFHSPVRQPWTNGVDASFVPIYALGTRVEPKGDFRDRLAYLIAASDRDCVLDDAVNAMMAQAAVQMRADEDHPETQGTGRVRSLLRPEAQEIVSRPPSRAERIAQLDRLAAIDEAHLGMLVGAGILGAKAVAPILVQIDALRADRYSEIADRHAPRGIYVLYEQALIARLGERVGGSVHLARSRNDINACLFKMQVRDWLTATFRALWRLRAALLDKAAHTIDVTLPVYSQFQPGQPGTLAYYLWSVETALQRDQQALLNLLDDLQVCPMGAGAGAGTDFPIRAEITAKLLGFSSANQSALDAIASRDLALRLLSAWAVCSTVLSRLAQDLQLWTMGDVGFFELPDDLTGGSSIMPQKKNPYLLEITKGKLVSLPGALAFSLHAMQKTPFSNAIEVGTEGVSACPETAITFSESCDLLRLMVEALVPRTGTAEEAARKGAVIATQVANTLVREQDLSFHQAHRLVAARIADALDAGRDPLHALQELVGHPLDDPKAASDALRYGGGPGAVADQLFASLVELRRDGDDFHRRTLPWTDAERRRRSVTRALIAEGVA